MGIACPLYFCVVGVVYCISAFAKWCSIYLLTGGYFMKNFLSGSKGNTVLGVILAILTFVFLNIAFGLGGAIGGAIAGGVGFGVAAVIKARLTPKEKEEEKD